MTSRVGLSLDIITRNRPIGGSGASVARKKGTEMKHLKEQAEGKPLGDPEYFYGVIDGWTGATHDRLYHRKFEAMELAEMFHGRVVILKVHAILTDDEEDMVEPGELNIDDIEAERNAQRHSDKIANELWARRQARRGE